MSIANPADRGIYEAAQVYVQRASMSGDGMWLEIYMATSAGQRDMERKHAVATIRADAGDKRRFEVATPEGTYSVPLTQIELAIEAAKQDVHSEDYYDKLLDEEDD